MPEQKDTMLLVLACTFSDCGGWALDTQFVPTMGVPYLLAHGLGTPVADAVTEVEFPQGGTWYIKAYTYNWNAPWKPEYAPGTFQIQVGNQLLSTVFGTQGDTWGWQDGGSVQVPPGKTELRLRDLTGLEGRCGMLLFCRDPNFQPPVELEELTRFVKNLTGNLLPSRRLSFDLVVAGGGLAGICAALSAARRGLKVALVQDRPMVGGNNSSEGRVWLGGETNFDPFPGIGNIVGELEQENCAHYGCANVGELYEDEKKEALLRREPNITLLLEHILTEAETENGSISGVTVLDVRHFQYLHLTAPLYLDATGDGTLGFEAGADFEVTTNGHMGMTNHWHIKDMGSPQTFPRCPWAIDLSKVPFPGRDGVIDVYGQQGEVSLGCWFWESGCEHDPIAKAEYARDTNFRAMYGAWDCLKNVDHSYENYALAFCGFIGGKRESRRLLGDIILTKSDVYKGVAFDDACVPSTWNFDVHYPDRRFYAAFHEGDGFITKDYHEEFPKPYFIPYRCMYSRNVPNLFMAGRDVSVSHDALGTVRVMRTGGMMGEVVGIAASLCKKYGVLPRQIYTEHLEEFMEIPRKIPKKK